MTNTIADITQDAQVLVLVGTNPEEAHPVLGMQIRAAVERGTRLVVVDPRDIGLAKLADVHLKLRPGTNVAFANGMAHVIVRDGLFDRAFVEERTDREGFEALCATVAPYTPERVADDLPHRRAPTSWPPPTSTPRPTAPPSSTAWA